MPTHMRARFAVQELTTWDAAEPFPCTKGLRTMRIPTASQLINPWQHGTLLFDLETDPRQLAPIADDEIELRMLRLLARLMHDNDAPRSQFERLAISYDAQPCPEHLLVRAQAERAAAIAEPLPELSELPAAELLATPPADLLADRKRRAVRRPAPPRDRGHRAADPPARALHALPCPTGSLPRGHAPSHRHRPDRLTGEESADRRHLVLRAEDIEDDDRDLSAEQATASPETRTQRRETGSEYSGQPDAW
jgi:hypothetical protein